MATQHKWLAWRVAVFLAALAPLLFWSWQVANNAAGPEPGRYLLLNIGIGALWLLLFTLSLTPLTKLTRWKGFALIRRQLGLWSLAYATLHMLSYALFILGLNWALLGSEIIKRPYIIVGMIALIGLAGQTLETAAQIFLRHFRAGAAALLLGGARGYAGVGNVCRYGCADYGHPPAACCPLPA